MDTLLYCMGEEAEEVLTSTNISDENRARYDGVIEQFETHFRVRRNVIFERARFNRRCQKEGESAEQYITELYNLIEFKDEMLRDRLVVGIREVGLSEKMQTDSRLTLESAKTLIRQKEAAKEHRKELHKDSARSPHRLHVGKKQRKSSPQYSKGGATDKCTPDIHLGNVAQPWELSAITAKLKVILRPSVGRPSRNVRWRGSPLINFQPMTSF